MNLTQLARRFPALITAGTSIELISPPGIGKSEFVEEFVRTMSKRDGFQWGLATAMLATYSPTDLLGYMVPEKRTYEGTDEPVLVSSFTMPAWMLSEEGKPINSYRRGIVFLDEWGQAEGDVKRASADLMLNRRVGPWKLHDGITVVAASNRASDRSGVTKNFDFVINRRVQVDITPDIASWEDWAFTHGVDPVVIAFANQNPQIVFNDGVPDKQGPWCTPRSLVKAEKILRALASGPDAPLPTDPEAAELAAGMIGAAAAAQLFAFVRLGQEMPQYADIIKNPTTVKVPTKADGQMLVCYSLAARVTEADAAPVVTYVERFPKEFSVTFAKAAVKRMPALVNTDAFGEWCQRNASLMSAITESR